jgi:hypothetical protein
LHSHTQELSTNGGPTLSGVGAAWTKGFNIQKSDNPAAVNVRARDAKQSEATNTGSLALLACFLTELPSVDSTHKHNTASRQHHGGACTGHPSLAAATEDKPRQS